MEESGRQRVFNFFIKTHVNVYKDKESRTNTFSLFFKKKSVVSYYYYCNHGIFVQLDFKRFKVVFEDYSLNKWLSKRMEICDLMCAAHLLHASRENTGCPDFSRLWSKSPVLFYLQYSKLWKLPKHPGKHNLYCFEVDHLSAAFVPRADAVGYTKVAEREGQRSEY